MSEPSATSTADRAAWFASTIDWIQCEGIALSLRLAIAAAVDGHGRPAGERVRYALRVGIDLGSAVSVLHAIRDEPTRERAKTLAAAIGALVSLTLECPGHAEQCMGLGKAELKGET